MSSNQCIFTIPGDPVAWQRVVPKNGYAYVPTKTKNFEQRVAMIAKTNGAKVLQGPVRMTIDAYAATLRRKDIDNITKAIFDGLNGICFEDDHQVKYPIPRLHIDRENPRTVVMVEPIPVNLLTPEKKKMVLCYRAHNERVSKALDVLDGQVDQDTMDLVSLLLHRG